MFGIWLDSFGIHPYSSDKQRKAEQMLFPAWIYPLQAILAI
jgi:hypothetical protein